MQVTDRFVRIPITEVRVRRDVRQRRAIYDEFGQFLNPDGLLESIAARGVLEPIIIDEHFELKAGERRLEASRTLGLPDIIARFIEQMTPDEAELVELEENLKRCELPWRDEVAAIARYHALKCSMHPGAWSNEDTIRETGYTQLSVALRVARDLAHPSIANCTRVREAYNVLSRRDERSQADALTSIMEAGAEVLVSSSAAMVQPTVAVVAATGGPGGVAPVSRPESIICADFREWAAAYAGPRFNLLHCDFPYSTGLFEGEMSGRDRWDGYDDSRDARVFEELIITLCANLDRILAPSAHVVFWLPADVSVQFRTLEVFRDLAPSLAWWPKPLVWSKSDNVGILSDPRRGPRHVYETALIASREDRPIVRATSDWYAAPTDKSHHVSTKPEPMLRYFFQMFVDEHTLLLDPTCGSGSALRAAESLGAAHVFGLDASPEHAANAAKALRSFRALRGAAA